VTGISLARNFGRLDAQQETESNIVAQRYSAENEGKFSISKNFS